MLRAIVQFVTLIALVMQAVLGSVAPVGVLCMHLGSCEALNLSEVSLQSCGVHHCCQSHSPDDAAAGTVITLALPCADDCQNCVDVTLPDLELASIDRVGNHAQDLSAGTMPLSVATAQADSNVPQRLPPSTGPPGHWACLHAPIIHSTRLLI